MLAHQEADPLGQEQRRIGERADAEALELCRRHDREPFEDGMDEPVVGIRAQGVHPSRERVHRFAVQQLQRTDADRDERRGFDELAQPDEDQDRRGPSILYRLSSRGVFHHARSIVDEQLRSVDVWAEPPRPSSSARGRTAADGKNVVHDPFCGDSTASYCHGLRVLRFGRSMSGTPPDRHCATRAAMRAASRSSPEGGSMRDGAHDRSSTVQRGPMSMAAR